VAWCFEICNAFDTIDRILDASTQDIVQQAGVGNAAAQALVAALASSELWQQIQELRAARVIK
jgi:NAD-dependent DNA ligase